MTETLISLEGGEMMASGGRLPAHVADATATDTQSPARKHTPGPWSWDSGVVPPDGPGRYSDIYVDDGDKIIASINEFPESSPEEGKANARLIAAAPDMYEALKLFDEALERWTGQWGPRMREIDATVRAAIAKAESRL